MKPTGAFFVVLVAESMFFGFLAPFVLCTLLLTLATGRVLSGSVYLAFHTILNVVALVMLARGHHNRRHRPLAWYLGWCLVIHLILSPGFWIYCFSSFGHMKSPSEEATLNSQLPHGLSEGGLIKLRHRDMDQPVLINHHTETTYPHRSDTSFGAHRRGQEEAHRVQKRSYYPELDQNRRNFFGHRHLGYLP